MYPDWFVFVLMAVAVFIWLGILSFLIWRDRIFLKAIFPRSGERDIRKKFEEVLSTVGKSNQEIRKLEEKFLLFGQQSLKHIQRVKLLRYNPYEDTGGNISFSLALLDKDGNGLVLTSLHARVNTRLFAKPVSLGKGQKYELSKEEQEVVSEALKEKI